MQAMPNPLALVVSGQFSPLRAVPQFILAVAVLGAIIYAVGHLAGLSRLGFWRSVGIGAGALVFALLVRFIA